MFGLNKSYILFHYTLLNLFSQPKFDNHSFDWIYKHPLYVKPEKMYYLTGSAEAPWLYHVIRCGRIKWETVYDSFFSIVLDSCLRYWAF